MSKKDSNEEFEVPAGLHSEPSLRTKYSTSNTGLILLVISYFFNSSMVVSTKVLETDHESAPGREPIKPLQILLVRMSITYVATLLYMFKNRSTVANVPFGPPEMRKWLVLRGVMGFFGVFGLYFSLMYLSLSDAILITFLTPTVTVLLAWLVLRERLTTIEAIGSLVSLCGVVLIVRPPFIFGETTAPDGSAESENTADRLIATVLSLVGVLGASSVYIIIRHMGSKAHAILSVSYFSLVVTVISLLGVLLLPSMTIQTPTNLKQWLLFANLGICGFVFQYLLTLGIQKERAGRGTLMAYTQLIYAVFWDVALWHNWPKLWSWLGMLIIVGTALVVIRYKPEGELARISDEERESFQMEEM